jgi:holo-[acyl-carrier protein] synthase
MILGIGSDIVNIDRIERVFARHGERFVTRCFTHQEYDTAMKKAHLGARAVAASLAKRFAAKEAMAKALGSGIAGGVKLRDLEVVSLPSGQPTMELHGFASVVVAHKTPKGYRANIHLSLSDDTDYAQAFIVLDAVAV